jgi:hypothetical protein
MYREHQDKTIKTVGRKRLLDALKNNNSNDRVIADFLCGPPGTKNAGNFLKCVG